jgi:TetR/AcrR family transcriptional repressor of lmrAB and yxaGH operons
MARPVDAAATRRRILTASGELMRRHGYAGTGIKAILAASGVPYGSLYYHFPGGKEQVGVETLRQGGEAYLALVDALLPAGADVPAAVRDAFAAAADLVVSTGYADACPVATIAGEIASTSEPMREAAAAAFGSWIDLIEQRLREAGIGAGRAREVAVQLLCLLEGAFLLARTARDVEALHVTGKAAEATVRAALTEAEAGAGPRAEAGSGAAAPLTPRARPGSRR